VHYQALIPFCILFASFVIFRIELVYSAFIALLSCVVITGGASPEALNTTLIFLFEIGLIIFGAFYFIKVADRKGIIHSLADLVKEVSPNRIVQSILVSFPLTMIVEGSSGFGTPLLIIAPLLRALGLPLILCAILPLINVVNGIPLGALGTPVRLGFADGLNSIPIANQTIMILSPLFWITPLLSYWLLRKKIHPNKKENSPIWVIWIFLLSNTFALTTLHISETSVEFPILAGGLITFLIGIYTAHFIEYKKLLIPLHRKGLAVYTLLLFTLWIGKKIWLDDKIPGTPLRIFNPGWVFIIFGLILSQSVEMIKPAIHRSRRTLTILFCMTFIVQQLKISGSMNELLANLPHWLTHEGTTLMSWLASTLIGTSTVAILFIAPLLDTSLYGVLAAGSALGVPLAFQSIVGVKSILKDEISEREILNFILPISVGFMTIILLLSAIKPSLD
jgi:L-lactate permease